MHAPDLGNVEIEGINTGRLACMLVYDGGEPPLEMDNKT